MASETKRTKVALSSDWQDLCVVFDDIAGVDVWIQNQGAYSVSIVFGGASAPADGSAVLVMNQPVQMLRGNADHIWVKGGGHLTVHVDA
jgi:hypothetical protein